MGNGGVDTLTDALLEILLLTPVRWLTEGGGASKKEHGGEGDSTSAQQLHAVATWMLQLSWPSAPAAAARRSSAGGNVQHTQEGGGSGSGGGGGCADEVVDRGGAVLDVLHVGVQQWQEARADEVQAAGRREKVLRWMAALAAAHDGLCDRILRNAAEPKGLLRAVLFLFRSPAPRAAQPALLAATTAFVAVATARAAVLTHQRRLLCLPLEHVEAGVCVCLWLRVFVSACACGRERAHARAHVCVEHLAAGVVCLCLCL